MTVGEAIAKSGGRRFILVAGASVVHTALFAFGTLTEGGYITLTLAILGGYLAANGTQKYIEAKNAEPAAQ